MSRPSPELLRGDEDDFHRRGSLRDVGGFKSSDRLNQRRESKGQEAQLLGLCACGCSAFHPAV